MGKTVFLDRDGTIIEEMGYINHFTRIKILPEAIAAIKLFKKNNFKVVVITNQAGVARGYFTEQQLIKMNNWMLEQLAEHGAQIDGLYYCPHHPEAKVAEYRKKCHCRKPNTGLVEKATKDLNLSLDEAWVIGDRASDIELANNLKIPGVFLLTGYGTGDYVNSKGRFATQPTLIFNNILQAAQTIVHCSLGRKIVN